MKNGKTKPRPAEVEADEQSPHEKAVAKLEAFIQEQSVELTVDDSDLNAEFKKQPSKFLAAAAKHNKAVWIAGQVKIERDALRADKSIELANSGEKLTVDAKQARLDADPEVQEMENKRIFADYQASQYQSVTRAWEHKRDMLIQMGSTARAEMQAGISVSKPGEEGGASASAMSDDEIPNPKQNAGGAARKGGAKRTSGKGWDAEDFAE